MNLRLGINTCFAVKRWPRAGDWAPIVRDRLGLGLVQHSFDLIDPLADGGRLAREVGDVTAASTRHGLDVRSTFTGLAIYSTNLMLDPDPDRRVAAASWYRAAIGLTARLGATTTGGHVGAFSAADWRNSARRSALWDELRATLRELAADAWRADVETIVIENLAAPREPSTMAQIAELLMPGDAGHASIALCLDVGHMCVPGTSGADRDPYAWLRELGRQAPIIQLQQSDAEGDHHWPFTQERNAAGRISAERVIHALGEGGVERGDLLLEVIPPFEQDDEQVLDDLDESVDYWRNALAKAGVDTD
jgi:sugar phosphate isomerase/epimerase